MSKSVRIAAVLIVVLVVLGGFRFVAEARDDKKPSPADKDFTGKVVAVLLKYDNQQSFVNAIQDARIKRLGDTYFLTGKVVGTSRDVAWKKGAVVWLPLHEVTQIVEYDSLDEVRKAVTLAR